MNTITITGNLTKDAELRYTNDGRLDGYYNASAFDTQATALGALTKGDRVIVSGRLVQRTYTDRDGVERTTAAIEITEAGPSFKFGQWPKQPGTAQAPAQGQSAHYPTTQPL